MDERTKLDIVFRFESQSEGNCVTSALLNGLEIVERTEDLVAVSISEAALTHLLHALEERKGLFRGSDTRHRILLRFLQEHEPAWGIDVKHL